MKKIVFLLIASMNLILINAQISEKEFQSLKIIYDKMGGKNWTNNTGWDFSKTANDVVSFNKEEKTGWYGISVKKGKLTKLDLSNNNLTGELPDGLFDLENLTTLNLSKNGIAGKIPTTISNLKNLYSLDFSSNKLSGKIPVEICNIGILASTKTIDESGNGGTEIRFNLSKNKLSGNLPINFQDMILWTKPNKSLKIDLSNNQLTGKVPEKLDKIQNLVTLRLGENNFDGKVPDIQNKK